MAPEVWQPILSAKEALSEPMVFLGMVCPKGLEPSQDAGEIQGSSSSRLRQLLCREKPRPGGSKHVVNSG